MYLAEVLKNMDEIEKDALILQAKNENPWFTSESVWLSIEGICHMLSSDKLEHWMHEYETSKIPRKVGLVMAGNIPMVGFHDLLSVYVSGHTAIVKLSHQDSALMKFIIGILTEDEQECIHIVERMEGIDAIIATGSNNSSRYFEYYFAKYPHIIRKNRTSLAVLNGSETDYDLQLLGKDIFSFYGLGCRNVSSLRLPRDFPIERLAESWDIYKEVAFHHKYANNYDYHKSIFLVNLEKHLDFGFLLLRETDELFSPVSVLHYSFFDKIDEVKKFTKDYYNDIQCVVGMDIPYGRSQFPELWDYADGIDTMKFLESI